MNDLLDDRLRTMMRTATADAPEAPTVDDLQAITVVGAEPRQRSLRPVAAAAAVVALVGAGALVWWSTGDDGQVPADETDTTEAAVTPGAYLDAYYLPSDLPDGWRIVGLQRITGGDVYYSGDVAVFRLVDSDVRGVVSQAPSETGETTASTEPALDPATGSTFDTVPVATSVIDAIWDPGPRWLSWTESGRSVTVWTTDRSEASARALAADLRATPSTSQLTFDLVAGSRWAQTRDYRLDGGPMIVSGSNVLRLVSDGGSRIDVAISRVEGLRASDLVDPLPGTADVFVTDEQTRSATRLFDDIQVEAYSFDQTATTEELVGLLSSLAPVAESDWLAATPDPAIVVGGAAVVATFELADHTVTAHLDGAVSGICVRRSDGVAGCALLPGVEADGSLPQAAPTTGIPLSDGTWVAVGDIDAGLEPCAGAELQGARAAVAPNGDQQAMLIAPARFDQGFACSLYRNGTADGVFIANPPYAP